MLLIGCGGTNVAPSAASVEPSASAKSVASAIQTPRSLTFEIHPLGDDTAHGTVVVDAGLDDYTMTITVLGLAPNTRHMLNMHGGTCLRPQIVPEEAILVADGIQADEAGEATFTTPLYPFPYEISEGGRILTVHNEPLEYRPDEEEVPPGHIGCADLTN